MRLWLSKLPENLGWEDVINAMITAHGERGGKHARSALENMLCSADDDMLNKIADAIEHIGQRVCIRSFIVTFTCTSNKSVFLLSPFIVLAQNFTRTSERSLGCFLVNFRTSFLRRDIIPRASTKFLYLSKNIVLSTWFHVSAFFRVFAILLVSFIHFSFYLVFIFVRLFRWESISRDLFFSCAVRQKTCQLKK